MLGIILAYACGIISMLVCVRVMNVRLNAQRRHYEKMIGEDRRKLADYSLDEAYRNGRSAEAYSGRMKLAELQSQNSYLIEQNEKLREQLGAESIFAHSMATNGRAAIRLVNDER